MVEFTAVNVPKCLNYQQISNSLKKKKRLALDEQLKYITAALTQKIGNQVEK